MEKLYRRTVPITLKDEMHLEVDHYLEPIPESKPVNTEELEGEITEAIKDWEKCLGPKEFLNRHPDSIARGIISRLPKALLGMINQQPREDAQERYDRACELYYNIDDDTSVMDCLIIASGLPPQPNTNNQES